MIYKRISFILWKQNSIQSANVLHVPHLSPCTLSALCMTSVFLLNAFRRASCLQCSIGCIWPQSPTRNQNCSLHFAYLDSGHPKKCCWSWQRLVFSRTHMTTAMMHIVSKSGSLKICQIEQTTSSEKLQHTILLHWLTQEKSCPRRNQVWQTLQM